MKAQSAAWCTVAENIRGAAFVLKHNSVVFLRRAIRDYNLELRFTEEKKI